MTETGTGERYRHTQVGWLMIVMAGVVVVLGVEVALSCQPEGRVALCALLALAAILILLFGWLRVVVRNGEVMIVFGIGLVRKRYALSEFVKVKAVRNKWYYGWGIRWWPGCLIYNVSGLDAVELRRANDTVVRIGTNEPEALKEALTEAGVKECP